ncbi:phenylacetate 2-hydroxylase [Trichoderma harzianum]|uniref:Phenylacetate 2-hydroxylase n=1 Tax=Trichoderma harzianum TaxID=5544 RepID=A0A0F9XLW9_TRIHA|nr:phenylacetate 2-hydroxylase [Trichoderma harzianum]
MSPWKESVKRARKAAVTALNQQAVQTYLPFIDLESTTSINELVQNFKNGFDVDPNGYFQRFSFNISPTLCYGIRIDGTFRDHTLNEVVQVERELDNIHGIAHNWQDYVPLLQLWAGFKTNAIKFRSRRDEYSLDFYEQLKPRIAAGTDNPCIAGNVLKNPGAKLGDTYLSSPHGQEIQDHMYEENLKAYSNEDPWDACLIEERCEFVVSFIKVSITIVLTHSIWGVPKKGSIRDITYKGAVIPAGAPFLVNMWAANHDPKQFHRPMDFIPDRFVGVSEAGRGTQHYGYGAGSRMCAGAHLANREL